MSEYLPARRGDDVLFMAEAEGEQVPVTRYNAVLQLVRAGHGIFNHCAVMVPRDDGVSEAKRFRPDQHQWEILKNTILMTSCTEMPDEEVFLLAWESGAFENTN